MLQEESPSSQFHWAMQGRNLPAMETLLAAHPALLSEREAAGECPLRKAIERFPEAVELLLRRGATVDLPDSDGWTPLHHACHNPDTEPAAPLEVVALLLDYGANVNAQGETGYSPLYFAIDSFPSAISDLTFAKVALLLERGADFNSRTQDGQTPLGQAYYRCHDRIIRLLRSLGAPYDTAHKEPSTLHWAIAENNVAAVRALLENSASIEERDPYGETPLIHAAFGGFEEMVCLLVEYGSDVTAAVEAGDERGMTALHYAYQLPNTVRLLVEAGASARVRGGWENKTPIEAILEFCGHPGRDSDEALAIVRFYQERGLLSQENRNELLLAAVRSESLALLDQIVQEFGPKWDQKTLQSAADMARTHYYRAGGLDGEIIRRLWQVGAVPGVCDAVSYGDLTTLIVALGRGGDPDEMNFNGFETITEAEFRAWYERTAVERPEYIIGGEIRTPLLYAVGQGDIDKVRLLLERGAKPDAWRDYTPASALWYAADKANATMVALLLEYGADARSTNRDGQSVLQIAAIRGSAECIALLQRAGARESSRA